MDVRRSTPAGDATASSTALDTVLFVVLVGVAVVTLAGATPGGSDAPRRVADETADVVATSTTDVTFERWGRIGARGPRVDVDRRASGTYAELLAAALLAAAELGSQPVTDGAGGGTDLDEAVVNATDRALSPEGARVQIRAIWRPYPGSVLGRGFTVGESPPRDADLSVATVTVPSGLPNATRDYEAGAASYDRIAEVIARRTVNGLFPPERMEDAMASEGPDRAIAASRYRRASEVLGVNIGNRLQRGAVEAANRRLAGELEKRLSTDLADEFETPEAAARAISVDRVRIVVRAWSP